MEIPVPRFLSDLDKIRIHHRNNMVDQLMISLTGSCDPEIEVIPKLIPNFKDLEAAIEIIQKNERGRQQIIQSQ